MTLEIITFNSPKHKIEIYLSEQELKDLRSIMRTNVTIPNSIFGYDNDSNRRICKFMSEFGGHIDRNKVITGE